MSAHGNKFSLLLFLLISIMPFNGFAAYHPVMPETLAYRLSYEGLFTSFIEADIADAFVTYIPDSSSQSKEGFDVIDFYATTAEYKKAEILYPLRMQYRATVAKELSRTLVIEKRDRGKDNSHKLIWLDWESGKSKIFEGMSEVINSDIHSATNDGVELLKKQIPGISLLEENEISVDRKFKFDEYGDPLSDSAVLDPLSMIYQLRKDLPALSHERYFQVVLGDDIERYRVTALADEEVVINNRSVNARKFQLENLDDDKAVSLHCWISLDEYQLPVLFVYKSMLGKFIIQLVGDSQRQSVVLAYPSLRTNE